MTFSRKTERLIMQLLTIQDPRDDLEKARLRELVAFAEKHSVTSVSPTMPAPLIRKILRSQGLTNIEIPVRLLGQVPGARGSAGQSTPENTVEMLADDDLMEQWRRQQVPEPTMPTVPAVPKANGHAHDYPNEVDRMREEAERAIREGQATLKRLQAEQELISELLPGATQDPTPEPKEIPIDSMKMTELRKACKAAGIKMKRTDKMLDLRAKLHGENTSQCSQ